MEIVYGKNPIREALAAKKPLNKIFVLRGKKSPSDMKIIQQARQAKIPVREVDRQKLIELVGHDGHQGFVALTVDVQYSELEDIFSLAEQREEKPLIALLDEIQDPHNLGAIIRSAEALGFHGIVIPKDRSAGLSATVMKTSAGAASHLPIVRVTNLARTMDELKSAGIWIVGADQDAEQTIYAAKFPSSLAVVIGSEGKGLRRLVREKCDFLVRIPLFGKVDSLNASVAAGIIFAEVRKKIEHGFTRI
ncbi:MAG: 23S rRNA (guanosine(2251)-2'-O)-methyltransferase RlmB [Calditrichaeota bacterium]|nr:23S rRNA (guanosine(2251)-2'-O)-methyltransferase RlmB [Calditrichota bacterium]